MGITPGETRTVEPLTVACDRERGPRSAAGQKGLVGIDRTRAFPDVSCLCGWPKRGDNANLVDLVTFGTSPCRASHTVNFRKLDLGRFLNTVKTARKRFVGGALVETWVSRQRPTGRRLDLTTDAGDLGDPAAGTAIRAQLGFGKAGNSHVVFCAKSFAAGGFWRCRESCVAYDS